MPATRCIGVRRGQIRIETGASDGSRLTLNFMGPGDLFGEVAVLDGQSRTADATAGEPIGIVRAAARGFPGLSSSASPRSRSRSSCCCASASAGRASGWRNRCCSRCRFAWRDGSARSPSDFGSEVHISQEQLGVFVGAARESVNRQLQLWRKDGILDLQRGRISAAEHDQADGGGEERVAATSSCSPDERGEKSGPGVKYRYPHFAAGDIAGGADGGPLAGGSW